MLHISSHKGVGVGLDLGLGMCGEGRGAALQMDPSWALLAHLAFCAFAGLADGVPAFVGADALSFYLLAADPADELPFYLSQLNGAQFFQGEFVLAAWTKYCFRLLFDVLYMDWGIF